MTLKHVRFDRFKQTEMAVQTEFANLLRTLYSICCLLCFICTFVKMFLGGVIFFRNRDMTLRLRLKKNRQTIPGELSLQLLWPVEKSKKVLKTLQFNFLNKQAKRTTVSTLDKIRDKFQTPSRDSKEKL